MFIHGSSPFNSGFDANPVKNQTNRNIMKCQDIYDFSIEKLDDNLNGKAEASRPA